MPWTMTSSRDGADVTFRIGAVKVANIHLIPPPRGVKGPWKAYLSFMDDEPKGRTYPSVSAAMRAMHEYLNSPPEEKPDAQE